MCSRSATWTATGVGLVGYVINTTLPMNPDLADWARISPFHWYGATNLFTPRCKWNPIHRLSAAFMRRAFQNSLTQASMTGKISWPVKKMPASVNGTPIGCGRFYDFIGINYYSYGSE